MSELFVQAHSHLVGMASHGQGDARQAYRATVVVVPKGWRGMRTSAAGEAAMRTVSWPADRLHFLLVLGEHERVRVSFPPAEDGSAASQPADDPRRATLEALLGLAQRRMDDVHDDEAGGDVDEGGASLPEAGHATPLVRPLPPMRTGAHNASGQDGEAEESATLVRAFLTLLENTAAAWEQHGRRDRHSPLLDWLLHLRLVKALEEARQDIRRGYVEREAWLPAVRGRVVTRALAVSLASGLPAVSCRYDAFTLETEVLRVVVTALEMASVPGPLDSLFEVLERRKAACSVKTADSGKEDVGTWTPGRVRRVAMDWRLWLAEVPAMPLREAAALASRLRVPASRPALSALADQARAVLLRRLHAPSADREVARDWAFEVPTSDMWEDLLALGARVAGREVDVEPAWKGVWDWSEDVRQRPEGNPPSVRPDLVLAPAAGAVADDQSATWIIDAKYRRIPKVPGSDGQRFSEAAQLYQMLAYARAFEIRASKQHPRRPLGGLLLAYPQFEDASEGQRRPWADLQRAEPEDVASTEAQNAAGSSGRRAVLLRLRTFPFPQPHDLGSTQAWKSYLASLSDELAAATSS